MRKGTAETGSQVHLNSGILSQQHFPQSTAQMLVFSLEESRLGEADVLYKTLYLMSPDSELKPIF